MEDSTPGSTEDQNPGGQAPSQEQTPAPADNQADNSQAASTTDTNPSADEGAPQVNQDSDDDNDDGDNGQGDTPDEVASWAKKQGYDLDNLTPDQAKTLAKRVIDNQKAFHDANAKLKAADTITDKTGDIYTDEDGQPSQTGKELAALRTERFFTRNEGAEEYAGVMADLIQKERESYGDDAARILANNLPRLLTLAKAESANPDQNEQYTKGRQDERQNLAKSQQAGAPASAAVSSAPQSQTITDKDIGAMSTQEYLEYRKTHNVWDVPAK